MSKHAKPPTRPAGHMEKPVMEEPQEEFVADQSVPSRDISQQSRASRKGSTPGRPPSRSRQ